MFTMPRAAGAQNVTKEKETYYDVHMNDLNLMIADADVYDVHT